MISYDRLEEAETAIEILNGLSYNQHILHCELMGQNHYQNHLINFRPSGTQ